MKLSKKTLAALSAATALVVGGMFTSCSDDDDDDPNETITKVDSNNYSVDYTNETDANVRGYNATGLKHEGGILKITIKNQDSKSGDGVMGFIWDLKDGVEYTADDGSKQKSKDFYLLGISYGTKAKNGKLNYYVSKFTNIKNIQDSNFGATTKATESNPKEEKITPKTEDFDEVDFEPDSDGNVTLIVDVEMKDDGSYAWGIYKESDLESDGKTIHASAEALGGGTIDATTTGYSAKQQNLLAIYDCIYPGRTLSGSWKFLDTYAAAETVEE